SGRRVFLKYPAVLANEWRNVVGYYYDPSSGYLARVTDLGGNRTAYSYNTRGELTRVDHRDASDNTHGSQVFTYFNNGQLGRDVVDLNGWVTRNQTFTYDARGKRTSMHDPFGRDSSVYNVLGQLIFSEKAERHDLRITEYSLDALGNIISRS